MIFLDHPFAKALDQILEIENPSSILLVTGDASYENSPAKYYFESLADKIQVFRYSGLGRNPKYEYVDRAIENLKNSRIDLTIAIGGGSIIDYAKLISLYIPNSDLFTTKFMEVYQKKAISPIVAIPTTAGTGSEATHFAVMYKDGEKYSIATDEILPRHAIIDPTLTYSMEPYLTASTGMDALCQAIESLWARGATDESKKFAINALKLLVTNIEHVVNFPDASSRKSMAIGAYYSGKAINISKTTGPHALSYFLTHHYGIPHGEAVAMTMEIFIKINFEYLEKDVKTIFYDLFEVELTKDLINRIKQIKKNIGLRTSIRDIGIRDSVFLKKFVSSVNIERMRNNPAPFDANLLIECMEKMK